MPARAWFRQPSDAGEALHAERSIAVARMFLAVAGLVVMRMDARQPASYAALTYVALCVYTGIAVSCLVATRINRRPAVSFGRSTHAIDLAVAALITFTTEGPDSPFFLYLGFPILAAAFRWGLFETLVTALAASGAVWAEAVLLGGLLPLAPLAREPQLPRQFVVNATYLVIGGLLVGYLAEEARQRRREAAVITHVIGKGRAEGGVGGTAQALVVGVARLFRANRALVTLRGPSGRVFLVSAEVPRAGRGEAIASSELDVDTSAAYMFETPGDALYGVLSPDRRTFSIVALDARGVRLPDRTWQPPTAFLERHPNKGILSASVSVDSEWSGRLLLLDPELGMDREDNLQLIQRLLREIGPYVNEVVRVHRLRTRAEAIERARLARELHDGVIQTLIGVDMQLEVLGRKSNATIAERATEINALQAMLRRETVNLRELTEEMKIGVAEVAPERVIDEMADLVDRFERQTGIAAKFVGERASVRLPPHARRELLRIVHEGLANVRRHSGARHVLVRAAVATDHLRLSIEDDGRGFPFTGAMTQAELETRLQGPAVIRERLRVLGGDITINSTPGRGARLDMSVPLKENA